jgi:PAS domain S-box-containing protein
VLGIRWQYFVAAIFLMVGATSSAALFAMLRNEEHEGIRMEFERGSQDRVSALWKTLDLDFQQLRAVKSLYDSSDKVERQKFAVFCSASLRDYPSVRAFQWVPRVRDSERSKYESAARDVFPRFQITECDGKGNLVPAARRDEYYPIFFVAPPGGNIAALGYDLAADPACWEAMRRARDTGQLALTPRHATPEHAGRATHLRLFLAVYRKGAALNTVGDRRRHLEGFVEALLHIPKTVESALSALLPVGINVRLVDVTDPDHEQALYDHWSRLRTPQEASGDAASRRSSKYSLRASKILGGRCWKAVCTAVPQFVEARTTWYPWGAGAAGLLMTGLLAAYLTGIARRNTRTARLAAQLAETNHRLKEEIAERQQAELTRQTSETKYKALYDTSSDAIMLAVPDNGFLSGNRAAVALYGCEDEQEFASQTPASLSPERQPDGALSSEKAQRMMAIAMREGTRFFEWTHRRLDGTEFPATVLLTRLELEGKPLLQATVRDITAQKRADEAMRASERRLRLFAENVSDVIWTMDFTGRFTYLSPSAEKMIGYKGGDNPNLTFQDFMTPSSTAIAAHNLEDLLTEANTVPRAKTRIMEFEMRRKDGSTGWIEVTANGMYDESGKMVAVQGVTRDITARKQMERELRAAKDTAEAATQAKSQFLASMSHEIRTPMTAILGYADLLMDPTADASAQDNYAAVIRRNGEHLLSLINDILDLSKIEAGRLALDMQRCSVVALLAEVASVVRPRTEQRGVLFKVDYAGPMPETILTDGVRLRQALINLAGNAAKFTEQGSVRLVASLLPEWRDNQPAVRIEVIDTGIGIAEEVLPRLFQPFVQGDASMSKKFGGTGLGLAISRQIAHLLGGDLTVASVLGQGSTFTLTVPTGSLKDVLLLQQPAEAEASTVSQTVGPPAEDLKGLRVLLAEDGYDNRELIRNVLCRAGAEVECVENGRMAVTRAEAGPKAFDVILMDMNMPEMDGYDATRMLRDHGYQRPILALTANAMSDDSQRCQDAGCDAHLPKPIDRAELIQSIVAFAAGSREPGEAAPRRPQPALPAVAASTRANERPIEHVGAAVPDKIVSQFAADPEMAMILGEFVGRLESQVEAMRHVQAGGRREELQRLAHRLKGAGGSYGYPVLTEAGKSLEDAAKAQDDLAAHAAIEHIAALCQAVQRGFAADALAAGVS